MRALFDLIALYLEALELLFFLLLVFVFRVRLLFFCMMAVVDEDFRADFEQPIEELINKTETRFGVS